MLLLGETGTGKEVAANIVHRCSARHGGAFVKMNCGNIPENLVDSELFGHEKGAFTGADAMHRGRFERADRGVLLLDELGELPLTAQARLLRVLQEGVIERVGGTTEIPVDVRIIAATHRNLRQMVRDGYFRQDLLYRLNLFPIHIPALRDRPEDIPLLLDFFLRRQCEKQGIGNMPEISADNLRKLCAYPWPGNIRELQNAVARAVILWSGRFMPSFEICAGEAPLPGAAAAHETAHDDLSLESVMRAHIAGVLEMTGGRVTGRGGAAELLKLNPSTLRAKMRKLGLGKERRPA